MLLRLLRYITNLYRQHTATIKVCILSDFVRFLTTHAVGIIDLIGIVYLVRIQAQHTDTHTVPPLHHQTHSGQMC